MSSFAEFAAPSSALKQSGHWTLPIVGKLIALVRHRRALSRLLENEDYLLADIGTSRAEIKAELARSIWSEFVSRARHMEPRRLPPL